MSCFDKFMDNKLKKHKTDLTLKTRKGRKCKWTGMAKYIAFGQFYRNNAMIFEQDP